MDNDYVVSLDKVGKEDIKSVGGKGANLGQLLKYGIPVPSGFAVTTMSFEMLIRDSNIGDTIKEIIGHTDVDDAVALVESSNRIKQMILSCIMPKEIEEIITKFYKHLISGNDDANQSNDDVNDLVPLVAVRSSATAEDLPNASFAGQQSSFLNIRDKSELLQCIKKCWASLYEPRAIFYRTKNRITKASISVIIQKMINADKSGIMFTVHPTTGEDEILIEATWGLGESIVGGEISPDSYRVNKLNIKAENLNDDAVVEIKISQKTKIIKFDYASNSTKEYKSSPDKMNAQVLDKKQILELANYGLKIEKYYDNQPQDIEFAIDKHDKIFFVQSRPITTHLNKSNKIDIVDQKQIVNGIAASPGFVTGKVRIVNSKEDIQNVIKGDIIVTDMTSPDLVPSMNKSAGIITDLGGRTCHAAIVSREMGIPAIVGTKNATKILQNDQVITIDAFNGIVYDGKVELTKMIVTPSLNKDHTIASPKKITTKTKIKLNLAFSKNISEIEPDSDGVGLLRLEHMIAQFGVHPAKLMKEHRKSEYVQMLVDGIRPIARTFNPKPVWIRTLDARTDEFRNLSGGEEEPVESNPMLGWHGIRRSLEEPDLLKAELTAIQRLHDEGQSNLYVMLPFVISVEEVQKVKEICKREFPAFEKRIGIMVETPASVLIIEDLCKEGISFASFGTNDLTQLILGIDRNNERLAKWSSVFHPAVLKSMKIVIDVCNRFGVETSICGESGSQPEMARTLVEYGIKSISCNRDAIDMIRSTVFKEEQ
jgi:pyruvate,water dikinase